MIADLRRRLAVWWMRSDIAHALVPVHVRRRWFHWREARRLRAEMHALSDAMLAADDTSRFDPLAEDLLRRSMRAEWVFLRNEALRHSIPLSREEMLAPEIDLTNPQHHDALRSLRRSVQLERRQRIQWWANIIIPILSLLVALAALLSQRACADNALTIRIP